MDKIGIDRIQLKQLMEEERILKKRQMELAKDKSFWDNKICSLFGKKPGESVTYNEIIEELCR